MGSKFNRPNKFLNYIKNPLSVNELDRLYKYHRVNNNRVTLYRDFVLSLCDLILETYLGDDVTEAEERLNHFRWCWKENENAFKEMGYDIGRNDSLITYFQSFFMDIFYYSEDKGESLDRSIKTAWDYVFNCEVVKSHEDVNNFIDLYMMFDESKWYKKKPKL